MNLHHLTENEKWLLDLKKKDPITGHTFRCGDYVVVCAKCKTIYLADTWKNIIGCRCASIECCSGNQEATDTLKDLLLINFCPSEDRPKSNTFIIHGGTQTNENSNVTHKKTLWSKVKQFFKDCFGG